jgi:hypothetical protein
MDPIANVKAQRASVAEINEIADRCLASGEPPAGEGARLQELAVQLAEQVEALDTWRTRGGFDPYLAPGADYAPVADAVAPGRFGRAQMCSHLMAQLLDAVMYRIPMEVRRAVMHEVPAAYNAWCGREIVTTSVPDGERGDGVGAGTGSEATDDRPQ